MDADSRRAVEDLLAAGRVAESLLILNKRIAETNAADPEAFYLSGKANFRLGDFSTAERDLRKAISLDPARADVVYYLGLTAERQKRNDEALKFYQTALALNPDLEKAREKVGKLSGFGPEATSNCGGPKTGAKQPELELVLPRSKEEFDDYKDRRRKKEEIDQRAIRDAKITLSHEVGEAFSRLPRYYKVVAAAFGAFFVLIVIVSAVGFFSSIFVVLTMNEGGGTTGGTFERTLDEVNQIFCDQAKRQGLTPTDC